MARELTPLDISDTPELLRLAEEVRASRKPRVLKKDDEAIAVLAPAPERRGKRARTKAEWEAFLSSAGGWRGNVDVDKFLVDNYESRRLSARPPVEL